MKTKKPKKKLDVEVGEKKNRKEEIKKKAEIIKNHLAEFSNC